MRERTQGPAARCARVRARGLQRRRHAEGDALRRGARRVAGKQRHRRRAPLAHRRHAAQRLSHHRGFDVRRLSAHGDASAAGHRRRRLSRIAERDERAAAICWWRWCPASRRRRGSRPASTTPLSAQRGWHGPGTIGPFGAAAAVGRLLDFDAATDGHGFRPCRQPGGRHVRRVGNASVKFHQFRGALSGLMAALLAEQDFVATREFLTAPDGGFYPTYCGGEPRAAATAALGEHWEMEQIALRPWPTSAASQGIVTRAFRSHPASTISTPSARERAAHPCEPACFDAYENRRDVQRQVGGLGVPALHRRGGVCTIASCGWTSSSRSATTTRSSSVSRRSAGAARRSRARRASRRSSKPRLHDGRS